MIKAVARRQKEIAKQVNTGNRSGMVDRTMCSKSGGVTRFEPDLSAGLEIASLGKFRLVLLEVRVRAYLRRAPILSVVCSWICMVFSPWSTNRI